MTVKEYFDLLFKCFFKIYSLGREIETWDKSKRLKTIIWGNLYNGVLVSIIITIVWGICSYFYIPFEIKNAFIRVSLGSSVCLVISILLVFDVEVIIMCILVNVSFSLVYGIIVSIIFGIHKDANLNSDEIVTLGCVYGFIIGVSLGVSMSILMSIFMGVIIGVLLCLERGVEQGTVSGLLFLLPFIIFAFLPNSRFYYWFYLPLYKKKNPLWWDENIGIPVPYLPQILRGYALTKDFDKTIEFTKFLIEERPVQRKSAQKGLILIALDKMNNFKNLENIQYLKESLSFLPTAEWFSKYYRDNKRRLFGITVFDQTDGHLTEDFNDEYQKYLSISNDLLKTNEELNYANRVAVYERTRVKLQEYRKAANLSNSPFAKEFGEIADSWQNILNKTVEDLRASGKLPLPNPYTLGKAIQADSELFLGRRDLIQKIETETLREGAATALLFIGNRRTGKSSTLNNLQRFVQSSLRTVFADLQDAEVNSSTEDFCEALTERIAKSLQIKQAEPIRDLAAFTKWLKQLDEELKKSNHYLLICIDEYERLEELISRGKLTELPNTLRYWIQHLQHVVFLLAGSHEPAELDGIDWTDYLINVRNVPISYLEYDAAMQLVVAPVPHFDLTWENDDLPVQLVHRLGRQPYLLQCAMWNLVEILNNKGIKHATQADIEKALEKVMDGDAANHFSNFWKTEMKDDSRQILSNLAKGTQPTEGSVLNLLKRKEIVALVEGQYVFCVPLLKEWILRNVD